MSALEPYVDAQRARDHVLMLRRHGVGPKSIAKVTGVPHGSLAKLIYGDPKRRLAPSKRIRPETERRILAMLPEHAPGTTMTPVKPVLAKVAKLKAAGVPKYRIAEAIGQKSGGLQIGLNRGLFVSRRIARTIDDLLVRHHLVRVPTLGPRRPVRHGVDERQALDLAHQVARKLCYAYDTPHLFDELVGAAVDAWTRFDYDPRRNPNPVAATCLYMEWRARDAWREWTHNRNGKRKVFAPLSLDHPLGGDDTRTLADVVPIVDTSIDRVVEIDGARQTVRRMLDVAAPAERALIEAFLADPLAQQRDIGELLGVSASRVSQRLAALQPLARSVA